MSNISFFTPAATILGLGTRDGTSEWEYPKPSDVIFPNVEDLKNDIKNPSFDRGQVDSLDLNKDGKGQLCELEAADDKVLIELYNALVSPDGTTWRGSPYANNILIRIAPELRSQLLQEPSPKPSNEPARPAKLQ